MATLRLALATIIRDDSALAAALPGGVWEHPLINEPGVTEAEGATPGAFDIQTGRLLPCAVISILGVGQSFAGTSLLGQVGSRPIVRSRAATIDLYEAGPRRDAIEAAVIRCEELFIQRQVYTDDLGWVIVNQTGNLGDARDPDLNAEQDRVNLNITSMRRGWAA